jgi:hypothetical protein
MVGDWLLAFVATVLLEATVVAMATRDLDVSLRRRLGVVFLGQALTHPLVWFVFPRLPGPPEAWFWVSELVAVLLEAILYARALSGVGALRAFGLSALANALSLGAGVAWSALAH